MSPRPLTFEERLILGNFDIETGSRTETKTQEICTEAEMFRRFLAGEASRKECRLIVRALLRQPGSGAGGIR